LQKIIKIHQNGCFKPIIINFQFTGLQRKVADNINILTLEPWNKGEEILVRYEHFFEKNDDPELSVETDVATIVSFQIQTPSNKLIFAFSEPHPEVWL